MILKRYYIIVDSFSLKDKQASERNLINLGLKPLKLFQLHLYFVLTKFKDIKIYIPIHEYLQN